MNMYNLQCIGRSFSESDRIKILYFVYRHPECNNRQVEHYFGISQPKAQRHLKYLVQMGLILQRKDGNNRQNKVNMDYKPLIDFLFSQVPRSELEDPAMNEEYGMV